MTQKIKLRKAPDGTLYPDNGVFKKWQLAADEEVEAHLAATNPVEPNVAEAPQDEGKGDEDPRVTVLEARNEALLSKVQTLEGKVTERDDKIAKLEGELAEAKKAQVKTEGGSGDAGADSNDSGDQGGGQILPEGCSTMEEAIVAVNAMTANECDVFAGKLGMEPFGSRVRVGDKQTAIIEKMQGVSA